MPKIYNVCDISPQPHPPHVANRRGARPKFKQAFFHNTSGKFIGRRHFATIHANFFSLLLFSPHFSIGAVACMHASNAPFHDGTRGPRRYVERRPAIDRWDYRVSCCNQWCATSCHALGPELSWLRGRGEGTETDQGSSTPLGIARLLRECPMFPAVR